MWAAAGSRLWDRDGLEWEPGEEVGRSDAEAMARRADVPVVVSTGSRPLRWLDGADRMSVWRSEIDPNFHDAPGWTPPPGPPGQKPYHAMACRRGDRSLLLITDFD